VIERKTANARVGVSIDDLRRLVRGPVVDDDQLQLPDRLAQNGIDRAGEGGRVVPAPDEDADPQVRSNLSAPIAPIAAPTGIQTAKAIRSST
jgi:hypothetical protein